MIRFLIVLLVHFIACTNLIAQKKFSREDILEDLAYLKSSLQETHYSLYTYITKEAFDQNFEHVKSSIKKDSFNVLETTSLFQSVVSKVNNGHTEIPFPAASYFAYADSNGTLFPLEIAFEGGKALIRRNLSDNNSIKINSEVISINGLSINEVLNRIFRLISAERKYFKLAKLELFSFPRYYWQAFGEEKNFVVEIKQDEQLKKYELTSIDLIDGFESKRSDIFSSSRELKFLENAAYLKPGNFSGDELQFKGFIDSCFVEIRKKNAPNLIIDLRNNLGGDDILSDYMVSYIADQPFYWCSEFSLKTSSKLKAHVRANNDTTTKYSRSILAHEDGTIFPYAFDVYQPQPSDKRYLGKVYALVNRQSHSQSAVTASQMQDYKFATIVGEETGDFPSLLASQYGYNLPRTGIEVKVSKGYIVRVNGSKQPEGVMPDIYIKDHLLDENDEILDHLLDQLNK